MAYWHGLFKMLLSFSKYQSLINKSINSDIVPEEKNEFKAVFFYQNENQTIYYG